MIKPKDVFRVVSEGTTKALKKEFGPQYLHGNEQMPALVAVALMQLSLRYFVETRANKTVVFDFFLDLMGIKGDRAKLVEEDGKLRIEPPKPPIAALLNSHESD
jgi:hypothetical protein